MPDLDRFLLPDRPRAFTVHYPLPTSRSARARQRALLARMDAIVAHSEHGAAELRALLDDPARVHRIPHGAFTHLTEQPDERPLPEELAGVEGPVVLCFGLVRPYKGVDVLLRGVSGARGRRALGGRHAADGHGRSCAGSPPNARRRCASSSASSPIPRSPPTSGARTSSCCRTARSSSRACCTRRSPSATRSSPARSGGFTEVGERDGALRLVPPGDPEPLAAALGELLADPAARTELAAAAARAAAGPYSWREIGARTLDLYRSTIGEGGS